MMKRPSYRKCILWIADRWPKGFETNDISRLAQSPEIQAIAYAFEKSTFEVAVQVQKQFEKRITKV